MESTAGLATMRSLLSKDLADVLGKELSMITAEYLPGSTDPVHTHHAQALVYVLEGSIVMQVRGGAPVTLVPGQTFYEDRTMYTSSAETRAPRRRPNFWCSWRRTKAHRF